MKSSLLVVGAGGFIASHLIPRLMAEGHDVVSLSRRPADPGGKAAFVAANLTKSDRNDLLRSVDGVVWLAGTSTPASSAGKPLAELNDNLRPLLEFMESSAGIESKRMVFVSTGGAIYGDVREKNAAETSHTEPKAYYSAGKAAAEAFLSAWAHEGGHAVTILRPSNVYGPGQPYRRGFGIVPTTFHAVMSDQPVVIRGDGLAIRDYLYVSDLVDLIVNVLDRPARPGIATFNASSSVPVPLNSLLDLIDGITGKPVVREYRPTPSYDVDRVVLDNTKARLAFGWSPRVELRDGLERSWNARG